MKKLMVLVLVLVASGAWAEWTGAGMWAKETPVEKVWDANSFATGYFKAAESFTMMDQQELQAWGKIKIRLTSLYLQPAVDQFYSDPVNAGCSVPNALKICLEQLISRAPDGARLLNLVYANVGGWKPYTTWAEYKAGLQN